MNLRLVPPMKLEGKDGELVQEVFDKAVHADVERLAKQVRHFAYGVTRTQLLGDGMRVASEQRVNQMIDELLGSGLFAIFTYQNHQPLIFHRDNLEQEAVTRQAYQLIAA